MAESARRQRKLYRSLLIGFMAMLAILWGLVYLLELPGQTVIALLLGSVFIVAGFALLGFLAVLLMHLVKRFRGRD